VYRHNKNTTNYHLLYGKE